MEKAMAFMFGNRYKIKLTVTVTRNMNDCFSVFYLIFLITTITGITAVITCHRILLIPQMGIHFTFKYLFSMI